MKGAGSLRLCNECNVTYGMTEPRCPGCGTSAGDSSQQVLRPERGAATEPAAASATDPPNGMSVAAVACGVVALFAFPPLFGLAGIVLAGVGIARGERLGYLALLTSVVGMVVGMVVGVSVYS